MHQDSLRPFMGFTTICNRKRDFEADLRTMVHEVVHALGVVSAPLLLCCIVTFHSYKLRQSIQLGLNKRLLSVLNCCSCFANRHA